MNRFMYCGYPRTPLNIKENTSALEVSLAYHDRLAFLYFESTQALSPEEVVSGDMAEFPDGRTWWRMTEIFHYFSCENDEEWKRKEPNKTPVFRVNYLRDEKIGSYIHYHYEHQEGNPVGCDRYGVIFIYGNLLIMYTEEPTEKILWSDIEGKAHIPGLKNWAELMDQHFQPWTDGTKGWHHCERAPQRH